MRRRISQQTVTADRLLIARMDTLTDAFVRSSAHLTDAEHNWPLFDQVHTYISVTNGKTPVIMALRGNPMAAPEWATIENAIRGLPDGVAKFTTEDNYSTGVLTIPGVFAPQVLEKLERHHLEVTTERGTVRRPLITDALKTVALGHLATLTAVANALKSRAAHA